LLLFGVTLSKENYGPLTRTGPKREPSVAGRGSVGLLPQVKQPPTSGQTPDGGPPAVVEAAGTDEDVLLRETGVRRSQTPVDETCPHCCQRRWEGQLKS